MKRLCLTAWAGGIKMEWGEIAIDAVLRTSGNTAYSEIAGKTAKL